MTEPAIVADDTLNEETIETQEESTEQAPKEEALTPPKVEFSPEQQEFIERKIVSEKVAKQREAERKAEEAERKAGELQAELDKLTKPTKPEVPPMPDQYADDFEEQYAAREQKLRELAVFEEGERQQAAYNQHQEQEAARKKAEEFTAVAESYTDRAGKLGIKAAELQEAGQQVASMGMSNEVVHHILTEDQGPAITVYLAKNPTEADTLSRMNPMRAAVYIATEIKPKAIESRPKVELAPAPTDSPKGGGFAGDGWAEGSGFE